MTSNVAVSRSFLPVCLNSVNPFVGGGWTHIAFTVDFLIGGGVLYVDGNSVDSIVIVTLFNTLTSGGTLVFGKGALHIFASPNCVDSFNLCGRV